MAGAESLARKSLDLRQQVGIMASRNFRQRESNGTPPVPFRVIQRSRSPVTSDLVVHTTPPYGGGGWALPVARQRGDRTCRHRPTLACRNSCRNDFLGPQRRKRKTVKFHGYLAPAKFCLDGRN
ncbi:hypothetical protein AMTR_s00010p00174880 [Amborella trichopoda]|uniref:Uncharacterized protein n=1 Tax=Amborella trichopoda TaxID=13333 RepID=W1NG91_AMBTC|nr:hypothetical protein AMTR_s00010p00174880 [Amborella trichopoda]